MGARKFNQTETSILSGMQEAVLYSTGRLKVKKHDISLPAIDVHEARDHLKLT